MSRTYRRKNYATTISSWEHAGCRRYGFDWTLERRWRWVGEGKCITYRPLTERELFERWYRQHGESRNRNERSPSRVHRKYRERQNRNINRQELARWLAYSSYEPLFEENPRSCWWDWR